MVVSHKSVLYGYLEISQPKVATQICIYLISLYSHIILFTMNSLNLFIRHPILAPGRFPLFVDVHSYLPHSAKVTWRGVNIILGESTLYGYKVCKHFSLKMYNHVINIICLLYEFVELNYYKN